jgi:hypothetical protein
LLIALVIIVALPLQGLAAARCMCKLHSTQHQAQALHPSADVASRKPATAQQTDSAIAAPGPQAAKANKAKHGPCPNCISSCCHVGAPAPDMAQGSPSVMAADAVEYWTSLFASWTEPVPHKPPRS